MQPERAAAPHPGGAPDPEANGPVGVIDIGSNSIRLVVFQRLQRHPLPLFNEKVLCGIGRRMATTGALDEEGMERARAALVRFCAIARAAEVGRLLPVATAAVREASNGPAFVDEASAICGTRVRVLSGEEEAVLAAEGVLCGIPAADGLVGDLGGGSLELTRVVAGERGQGLSLPLGPLRLIDHAVGGMPEARRLVDAALERVPWLPQMAGRPLYAVGGVWRSLARLHMSQRHYPLHILQHYEIRAEDALKVARTVAGLGRKTLQAMTGLSRRRLETMPFGALVLERLVAVTGVSHVVVSAFGVREGLLFDLLSPEARSEDPLVAAARALAGTLGRRLDFVEELAAWIDPLFAGETAEERRLRHVAALLSDTAWRDHPDYRGELAFQEILRAPFAGIDHPARAFLALCVFHRYGGEEEGRTHAEALYPIAGSERTARARVIGSALRLGHVLAASTPHVLPRCRLALSERGLSLTLPRDLAAFNGEAVRKRLSALGACLDRVPVIDGLTLPMEEAD